MLRHSKTGTGPSISRCLCSTRRWHGYHASGLVAHADGGGSEISAHNGEDRSITAEGMRRDFGALHAVDGVGLESVMALWATHGATKLTS